MRVFWELAWLLFCRYSRLGLVMAGALPSYCVLFWRAKIGHHCHIYPKVKIWAPWNLELHDYACLANDVTCYSQAKITLHERAIVSQGAHLCTGSHDYNDPDFQLYAKPIIICKDAWVCAEAFIGPGVSVGEGAVLGARAVAFKNLEPWQVYSGNPAKAIKHRQIRTNDNAKT